jgi:hypothetical protein
MLPSDLCGQSLWLSSNLIWRKRTADMLEHICGSQGKCLKMGLHIRDQEFEISPLMIMGDHPSRDAPEPFNAVRIRIIGRRIDHIKLLLQLGEHAAHQQRTGCSVRLESIGNHKSDPPATGGASHGRTHLFTEDIGGASSSNSAIEPAIAPVEQAKPIDFPVVSRGLDQALPASPLEAPDPRECRVKGELHLILQREVGLRQEGKQRSQIGGKLSLQVSLDQRLDG